MKKIPILSGLALCLVVAACGGGDDAPASAGPAIRLAYSGAPLVAAQRASVRAAAPTGASGGAGHDAVVADNQATIDSLQAAFKVRGADIAVYPGTIDGTTLHELVMSENSGVAPTDAELRDIPWGIPTEWVLVNFKFADMVTRNDDPVQRAAIDQFERDLDTYAKREYLKGRVVYAAQPLGPCDHKDDTTNPIVTLSAILSQNRYVNAIGGMAVTPEQMDSTCLVPNDAVRSAYVAKIADRLFGEYTTALDTIDKCKHNPEAIPEYERAGQCWGITPEKK
ncbi:hypothetical protein [Burkholderia mayonis]|uniref:Lipoprotein n=1 Tax=Burkholderia mayonis TaxID=1385591 RepID=A0A1B4FV59_9BURK|nr:hypothetical protein [Burkholderia mayonis]AOJ07575.1 hypothetical protein WS71_09825 [Burkholderia mayonis]